MIRVENCTSQQEWDEYVLDNAGHPLQLWGWGEVKAKHNWKTERVFVRSDDTIIGAAQLLIRRLPKPFSALVYLPRGPVVKEQDREDTLDALANYAKTHHKAVAISIEPDWEDTNGLDNWKKSTNSVLLAHTLELDLRKSEDELLADMSKKTRQYIRKSQKENIEIRRVQSREELQKCLEIYKQTAKRAQFALHDDQYYYDIFDDLGEHSPVFAAFAEGEPVSFLWLALSQETAFELYGGMSDEGQRLRANYCLKWTAIQQVKKWCVHRYDMNGLLNDGVSSFKQGFASHEDEWIGTYDRALSPLYSVWSKGLPTAKRIVRTIKNR